MKKEAMILLNPSQLKNNSKTRKLRKLTLKVNGKFQIGVGNKRYREKQGWQILLFPRIHVSSTKEEETRSLLLNAGIEVLNFDEAEYLAFTPEEIAEILRKGDDLIVNTQFRKRLDKTPE
ncbi:MAG: hypothetical protein GWO20_12225 [Candidatus Korarchaeota archaeon]|nr:hypothetical protein [Candidatus Korarchaeota archaeon]NIU84195.1 hypothetical protein [Candidatus Thorarchaeota archaeon]NIW14343.1 hypothetical protein [Candidatus Thorarchaeota archaeon]NIW52432.1 hypothetical protein [Candidatus Korarchaeota archaeon]